MKKIIFCIAVLLCHYSMFAQLGWDFNWDIKSHDVGQLHFQFGTAVPIPNWNDNSKNIEFKINRIDNNAFEKYKSEKNFTQFGGGPLYARFEYGFTRRLSVNVGITYTNYKARFSRDSVDVNIGKSIPWEYGLVVNNISGLARLNYHLYVDPRWDIYLGGGLGYDNYAYSSYTKYPPQVDKFNAFFKAPAPITFEAGTGLRYFFMNRTAWYVELGYGKTFLQTGVMVKITQPKLNRSY